MTQHADISVDETLDTSGLLCPLPVYQASLVLKRLEPGQVLEVVCTDPGSLADFPALARQTGNVLLSADDRGDTQVFLLEKRAAPTSNAAAPKGGRD
jgi:tRNA 2-thiouridine synthesizing protein A